MIIANPLYDTTFKMIMGNNNVAKLIIGTILDCEILSLTATTIERARSQETEQFPTRLLLMDYAAEILTKDDVRKKVLIEVQKAPHQEDVLRFRRYLGYEYINTDLQIIVIYILGFNLTVEDDVFMMQSHCRNLRTGRIFDTNDVFVKGVNHITYFIQANRLAPAYHTRLDKLLSLFAQKPYNIEGDKFQALSQTDVEPELKELTDILEYVAGDVKLREELQKELEMRLTLKNWVGKKDEQIAQLSQAVLEKDKALEEKDEKLFTTAKYMKQKGVPIEEIAEITGLTIAEIKKL